MLVLLAVASRHGSTREIGDAVATVLRRAGLEVDVLDPDEVEDTATVERYDAVVLGSSVYVGRWAASARALVDRCGAALAARPVWLFSSGGLGVPVVPAGDPDETASLLVRLGARGHRSFAGRLDPGGLSLAERAVVALVRAPEGDFRDWDAIEAWATEVAEDLSGRVPALALR